MHHQPRHSIRKFKEIYLVLLMTCSISAVGQSFVDIARVDHDYGFRRPYDADPAKSGFQLFTADLNIPIVITDKIAVITGVNYENLLVPYITSGIDEGFHGLMIKTGVNIRYSKDWSGSVILLPKISSNEIAFSANHTQYGGLILVKKRRNIISNWKFGLYTNTELSGLLLVPIVGFYMKREDNFEINLTLPLDGDINVQVMRQLKAGIHFRGIVKSYHIASPGTQYLHSTINELGAYGQYELGRLIFRLTAGTSIGRSFRTFDEDDKVSFAISALKFGDNRTQLNQDFKDGFYIRTGLVYRINPNHRP